jgi:autoinducer 2-degrading protein
MIVLCVKLTVREGEQKKVAELFPRLQTESRKEPGCLQYMAHQSVEEPRVFLVYERYKDEAALEAHRASPHFRDIASSKIYPLVEKREADLFRPL